MFAAKPPQCRVCFSTWKPRNLKSWGGYYNQCQRCALQEVTDDEIWEKVSESRAHWDAIMRPGEVETELFSEGSPYRKNPVYYGTAGAGILFKCQDQILLLKRSEQVREPGTWGIPGGALTEEFINSEDHNTVASVPKGLLQVAIRESHEELGGIPPFRPLGKVTYRDGSFVYVTYLVGISTAQKDKWKFQLNWENTKAQWFRISDLPPNLHFGVRYVLAHIRI